MADHLQLQFAEQPDQVLELLALPADKKAGIRVGTAILKKGERIPAEGQAVHPQTEISLILKGDLLVETASEHRRMQPGDVVRLAPGEAHHSIAHEDTEIFWVLFGDDHAA